MEKLTYYYGAGNTSKGFRPLYNSIFKELDRIYSLNGGSNTFKTTLLKEIIDEYSEDFEIEVIVSSIDCNEIEGLIIRKKNVGIINGTPLHGKMNLNLENIKNIDLDVFFESDIIEHNEKNIKFLKEKFNECMEFAQDEFEKALKIHDYWEGIYFPYLNFHKANELTDSIISLLREGFSKKDKKGKVIERYLGASTPIGAKDFVPNITEGVKRYFLKGRAGTGKSTILKKIAKEISEYGYDIEVYACGFDPDSKDMVISRELNFAIFDSTPPHEYFPSRDGDEIIDVYKIYVEGEVDKIHKKELEKVSSGYKDQVSKGSSFLANGESIKNKLDEILDSAFDYNGCKKSLEFLFNEKEL